MCNKTDGDNRVQDKNLLRSEATVDTNSLVQAVRVDVLYQCCSDCYSTFKTALVTRIVDDLIFNLVGCCYEQLLYL